jgi:hypothetical protein
MLSVTPSLNRSPSTDFVVRFGSDMDATDAFNVPLQVLGGATAETIFHGLREVSPNDGWRLFERDGLLVGAIDEVAEVDLGGQAHRLYRRLLALIGGRRLARVWNYVPRINEPDASGLENYRAFCRGRSLAFEERLGGGYEQHLPAASAVGGVDGRLVVVFAATPGEPEHIENPEQVPAYAYPPEHGPRPPSFSRATRVEAAGRRHVFISGTAAIKGHATVAVGDLEGQIACTLDNLRIISRVCDLGDRLGEGPAAGWQRHFKVYLRHAADYDAVKKAFDQALFRPTDHVTWLRSDICRSALLIEIEATLTADV